ncbi:histidine phosphatase family protein [Burkholderia alba]|uniref:histidine phosphatase family protein n=1 Tax=Burkholderia alba TaxID=2683677 RepID=UPI002B056ABC|nr:histidine phosphatase family protein [Burkholderia alba]
MDLVLIRHPAVAVDPGVCYGGSDVALAGDADEAAAGVMRAIDALRVPAARAIGSSPLTRCMALAQALARLTGMSVHRDSRLREIDFGAWERQRWDAIGPDAIERWRADLWHAREHGGESVAQFAARVAPVLAPSPGDEATRWQVTHAGVIRALAAQALDEPLEAMLQRPVAMGGVVWLRGNGSGTAPGWRLVHWDA